MIGGGRSLLPEILGQSDRVRAKSLIFDLFSLVTPRPQHLAKKVEHRMLSLSPQGGGGSKRSVKNLNNKLR